LFTLVFYKKPLGIIQIKLRLFFHFAVDIDLPFWI